MSEINFSDYSAISDIPQQRERLKLPKLEFSQSWSFPTLVAQSGSLDQRFGDTAIRQLRTKWLLSPERESGSAETVNLMELVGQYSENERRLMFNNLSKIELTWGCNGDCYFCFGMPERGVKAKFSFDSVKNFMQTYKDSLPQRFSLYGDNTDPFDYRDSDHNFLDIYKAYREIRLADGPLETSYQFISTSIPRGGQRDFIDFMKNIIKEQKEFKKPSTYIRVSLAEHNIQRVETTFEKLVEELLTEGFTKEEINDSFDKILDVSTRFSDKPGEVRKMGKQITGHDDYRDIEGPACYDGVEITPEVDFQHKPDGIYAIAMVATNVYAPSGYWKTKLKSGMAEDYIPKSVEVDYYTGYSQQSAIDRITSGNIMLKPVQKATDGSEIIMKEPTDNYSLRLGRDTLSMTFLMQNLYSITTRGSLFSPVDAWTSDRFMDTAVTSFRERQKTIESNIHDAKEYLGKNISSDEETTRLQFYIKLAEFNLKKTNFVIGLREHDRMQALDISAVSLILRQIGRDQVDHLQDIMDNLLLNADDLNQVPGDFIRGRKAIVDQIVKKIGPYFKLEEKSEEDMPRWFRWLVDINLKKVGLL